ncbi:MAG: carbon-nitrogen hydrolase family protein [Verrucomicrobiales bacterium]
MRLAVAQMRVDGAQREANLQRAAARIGEAARGGADLVLLPEALNFGWMHPSVRETTDPIPDGESFQVLAKAARDNRIAVCAGLVERDNRVFNSAVLIDRHGELLLHHRKIHELEIARDLYALGDSIHVADTAFGTAGLHVCSDAFAPGQWISRQLCDRGADFILSPCAWAVDADHDPKAEPYGDLWRESYVPVAKEYGVWIAGCSNVGWIEAGPWQGRKCIGNSIVIGRDGEELRTGPYGEDADELFLVELN